MYSLNLNHSHNPQFLILWIVTKNRPTLRKYVFQCASTFTLLINHRKVSLVDNTSRNTQTGKIHFPSNFEIVYRKSESCSHPRLCQHESANLTRRHPSSKTQSTSALYLIATFQKHLLHQVQLVAKRSMVARKLSSFRTSFHTRCEHQRWQVEISCKLGRKSASPVHLFFSYIKETYLQQQAGS